jgi:hypothetical protein
MDIYDPTDYGSNGYMGPADMLMAGRIEVSVQSVSAATSKSEDVTSQSLYGFKTLSMLATLEAHRSVLLSAWI